MIVETVRLFGLDNIIGLPGSFLDKGFHVRGGCGFGRGQVPRHLPHSTCGSSGWQTT